MVGRRVVPRLSHAKRQGAKLRNCNRCGGASPLRPRGSYSPSHRQARQRLARRRRRLQGRTALSTMAHRLQSLAGLLSRSARSGACSFPGAALEVRAAARSAERDGQAGDAGTQPSAALSGGGRGRLEGSACGHEGGANQFARCLGARDFTPQQPGLTGSGSHPGGRGRGLHAALGLWVRCGAEPHTPTAEGPFPCWATPPAPQSTPAGRFLGSILGVHARAFQSSTSSAEEASGSGAVGRKDDSAL
jgi:hypothetical protein